MWESRSRHRTADSRRINPAMRYRWSIGSAREVGPTPPGSGAQCEPVSAALVSSIVSGQSLLQYGREPGTPISQLAFVTDASPQRGVGRELRRAWVSRVRCALRVQSIPFITRKLLAVHVF